MISHDFKCIFVHPTKCGGTSIFTLFCDHYGLTKSEGKKKFNRGSYNQPNYDHNIALDYVRNGLVSEETYNEYFVFSVCRDPIKRFVSFYTFMRGENNGRTYSSIMNLDDFADQFYDEIFSQKARPGKTQAFNFVRPQFDFVTNEQGKMIVDCVMDINQLNKHFSFVKKKIGFDCPRVPHLNKSGVRIKDHLRISDKVVKLVKELYPYDFSLYQKISIEDTPWFQSRKKIS